MLIIKLQADGARGIAEFQYAWMVACAKIIATSLTSSNTDSKEYEIESKLNHLCQSVWPIRVQEHVRMRN